MLLLPQTTWDRSSSPTCSWVRLCSLTLLQKLYCGYELTITGHSYVNIYNKQHLSLCFFSLFWLTPDLMKRSAPARIVTLSSVNHKKGEVDFSHFRGENLNYFMDIVYNHTKLHNIICTNELARRLEGTGRIKWRCFLDYQSSVWIMHGLSCWTSATKSKVWVFRSNKDQ